MKNFFATEDDHGEDFISDGSYSVESNSKRDQVSSTSSSSEHERIEALRAIAFMVNSPLQAQQNASHVATRPPGTLSWGTDYGASTRETNTTGSKEDAMLAMIALLKLGVNPARVVALVNDR